MQGSGWLTDPRYDAGLEELVRLDREEAAAFAARVRVLAGLASRTSRDGWQGEAPFDSLVLDVAGSCLLGQVAAGSRLVDAEHLVVRLPGVVASLEQGALRVPQAQVLVEQTRSLTPGVCAEVERRVLPQAGTLCPADLRRLLKRTVLEVDAEAVAQRASEARRSRRSWVRPAEDGMALLCALLPAEQAQAAFLGLTAQARQARRDGDSRTLDQLRADLLAAPWLGEPGAVVEAPQVPGRPAAFVRRRRRPVRPVRVVVHVPLAVAQGLSDAPAELEGYGPVSAAHARRLLLQADLQRACVDPQSGQVWALDEHVLLPDPPARPGREVPELDGMTDLRDQLERRRQVDAALRDLAERPPPVPLPPESPHDPSAGLSRLVRARDTRCDGPGCSLPAARCELDHETPWPDGGTSAENLVARSQRCHHAKHHGWSVERSADGTTWTSPSGRRYPVPHRRAVQVTGRTTGPGVERAVALAAVGFQRLSVRELLAHTGATSAVLTAGTSEAETVEARSAGDPGGARGGEGAGGVMVVVGQPGPDDVPPPF